MAATSKEQTGDKRKRDCPGCGGSNTFHIIEVVGFERIMVECTECGIWADPEDLHGVFVGGE